MITPQRGFARGEIRSGTSGCTKFMNVVYNCDADISNQGTSKSIAVPWTHD
jgi:hypothetical protein